MSYTPYTWQSGDTVTAARLNNIEQGIANADGGSGVMYFDITIEGTFPNNYFVSSKSFTEIMSAISSGILPVAKYVSSIAELTYIFSLANFNENYGAEFTTTSLQLLPDDTGFVEIQCLKISLTNEVTLDVHQIPIE